MTTTPDDNELPLSVGDLNREVDRLLATRLGLVHVEGEIAGKRVYPSGHCYFTLKDTEAAVSCVLFRTRRARAVDFADGDHVRLHAKPGLYAARGQFQLIVESITPAGAGALLAAFEALRKRLTAEGLFDTSRKRPLPALARRLGVITSAQGDVRHDIARTLARRFPMLLPFRLYPCAVQGARAAPQIVAAIEQANREALCDILIVARGGGSLEDLWAFNEEPVVRAIAGSVIPIVTGVGHETDTTLADYAADLRAPTPTGAAECVSPDQQDLRARLTTLGQRLVSRTANAVKQQREWLRSTERRLDAQQPRRVLDRHAQRLDELGVRLERGTDRRLNEVSRAVGALMERHRRCHPARRIAEMREAFQRLSQRLPTRAAQRFNAHRDGCQRLAARFGRLRIEADLAQRMLALDKLGSRLQRIATQRVATQHSALAALARSLAALDPFEVVGRGYAIVHDANGRVVSSAAGVETGAVIRITLADGVLDATTTGARAGSPRDGDRPPSSPE